MIGWIIITAALACIIGGMIWAGRNGNGGNHKGRK